MCERNLRFTSGTAGAGAAACFAHVVGGLDEDWYEHYTAGCSGHDEPELDPVSSAPGSAQNITWRVALPADGTFPVSSVGPAFWFGGTVNDTNPKKIGGEGFLELQFYPDSFTKNCFSNGGFSLVHAPDVYTACSPVWTLAKQGKQIAEPAAFNGMLTDATGKAPFVMQALDDPATNFGWILVCGDELNPDSARRFGSREDSANAPALACIASASASPFWRTTSASAPP